MAEWKLVPVEPTPEMVDAGCIQSAAYPRQVEELYRAMLAAAPTEQAAPQEPVAEVSRFSGDHSGSVKWLIDDPLPAGTPLYARPFDRNADDRPDR